MITITASRKQTRIIQAWFGSGSHAFDPVSVPSRTFTYEEILGLNKPTTPEYEEVRKPARELLWDLFNKLENPEVFKVVYSLT